MVEEFPLYKLRSSLLPSLNIDYTLLGSKTLSVKDLLEYETDLVTRYQERLNEIESLKSLQKAKKSEPDVVIRRSVGEQFQKVLQENHKKIEERSLKVQNFDEKSVKVQQLMSLCPGLKNSDEATFYLEAQNYNVENAKNFYTSCTGRSNIARASNITIKFVLPGKIEFSESFDGNSLLWSMLAFIHKKLPQKRNFKVKIKATGKEIPFEYMTKKTFGNFGIPSNTILVIEYI
jgi:UBA-like domain